MFWGLTSERMGRYRIGVYFIGISEITKLKTFRNLMSVGDIFKGPDFVLKRYRM